MPFVYRVLYTAETRWNVFSVQIFLKLLFFLFEFLFIIFCSRARGLRALSRQLEADYAPPQMALPYFQATHISPPFRCLFFFIIRCIYST